MGKTLIPLAQQGPLNAAFHDLHATMGRSVSIFKTAKEVVISTNNNHNFLFQGAPTNDTVQEIVQSGVFLARVMYGGKQERLTFGGLPTQQPLLGLEDGEVRLKLDVTGAAFLAGAERVIVDGNILKVFTSAKQHSLIGTPDFQDFYFKKIR